MLFKEVKYMTDLVFVGIEHTTKKATNFTVIAINEEKPRFGTNSLEEVARKIAFEFGESFEEHVTLQVPENISGECYQLTSSDMECLKLLIKKILAEKKYPEYIGLTVEKVIDNGQNGIEIYFENFGIIFTLPLKDIKRYALEGLSLGDVVYVKSKTGNENYHFLGINQIADIQYLK